MTTANVSKVLLVEDDSSMQALLRTLLEIEGYRVAAAPEMNSPEQILETIRVEKPDYILLDVHLRGTSGLDVVQQIRLDPELQGTRVIMTSGMDVKDQCVEAGANDFLMKPYMVDELLKKLRG